MRATSAVSTASSICPIRRGSAESIRTRRTSSRSLPCMPRAISGSTRRSCSTRPSATPSSPTGPARSSAVPRPNVSAGRSATAFRSRGPSGGTSAAAPARGSSSWKGSTTPAGPASTTRRSTFTTSSRGGGARDCRVRRALRRPPRRSRAVRRGLVSRRRRVRSFVEPDENLEREPVPAGARQPGRQHRRHRHRGSRRGVLQYRGGCGADDGAGAAGENRRVRGIEDARFTGGQVLGLVLVESVILVGAGGALWASGSGPSWSTPAIRRVATCRCSHFLRVLCRSGRLWFWRSDFWPGPCRASPLCGFGSWTRSGACSSTGPCASSSSSARFSVS